MSCACSRPGDRPAGPCRSTVATLEIAEAVPDAFEGVDIALFSRRRRHLARSRAAGRRPRRDRHRQLVRLADGHDHPAGRLPGQPGRPRGPPGHHRQPELLDDAARAGPDGAARHGRPRAGRGRHLPVGLRHGRATRSPSSRARSGRTSPARHRPRRVYPHPIAFNALPEIDVFLDERLHQGGVEGRQREPQDPAPAGPADLVHGGPHPGLRQPLGGRPRRDARPDDARSGTPAVRRGPGRDRPGRPGRAIATRWRPRRPAATRSSSGASAATSRSRTTAGSPSGSCRTTCARARRRTPSSWPRSCASATGSAPRRSAAPARTSGLGPPRPRRDRGRAPSSARGHRRGGPGLHELPAARDADAGGPGRGRPRDRGRVRRRGPRLQRGPAGPAVRRSRRRPAGQAARPHRLAARGRVHHERREVPAARQPRPAAGRDRRLRAVPAPAARGPRSGGRGHPRPLLDGHVHARRADLAGARDRPPGGSGHRRGERAGVRDVPPGRGSPDRRPSSATAMPTSPPSRQPCSTRAGAGSPSELSRPSNPSANPTANPSPKPIPFSRHRPRPTNRPLN